MVVPTLSTQRATYGIYRDSQMRLVLVGGYLSDTMSTEPGAIGVPSAAARSPIGQRMGSGSRRLWVQVDCHAIAELASGRARLARDSDRPLFIRIARSLLRLHHLGWLPATDTSDLVVWTPRDYNNQADHAANAALDAGAEVCWTDWPAIQTALWRGDALRLCVDGGLRSTGAGAMGMTLLAARRSPEGKACEYRALVRRGSLLRSAESAFHTEALAIEWAPQHLISIVSP